jgi:peptidyl-prolyl cis-trans isomerase SurA
MKKIAFFLPIFFIVSNIEAQTVITYGKNTVSKEEFLRAYNKNKSTEEDKEKAIREYATLYSEFKLKVQAAKELKIDTLYQIKNDLDNFRHQVEGGYLNDEKSFEVLLSQALKRSQYDLHLLHYSINIDPNSTTSDTLKAFKAMQSLYENLASPTADFQKSEEINFSDLGFITVFSLPYQYENIVYNLKPGDVSLPYRSKKSWHVFKLIEQRRSVGKWKVAQILFTFPQNPDDQIKIKIRKVADSVYKLLKAGADFGKMAREMSEDKLTYLNNGEIPEFGTGKYEYSFEKEVVQLSKDGDIAAPFETKFGIHLIKRISHTPTPAYLEDEALVFEIKNKLMQDNRVKIAKEKFARDVKQKIGFKLLNALKEAELLRLADSIVINPEKEDVFAAAVINKPIIGFSKSMLKVKDWLNYVKDNKINNDLYSGETNAQLWERYKEFAILEYYKNHLEEFNSDFAYQMQEFKEGNMLFEVMEKQVWSKAGEDTIGLLSYYNANKEKYKWAKSADVLIMNCATEDLAQQTINDIQSGASWKELVELREGELQGDSGRLELAQINSSSDAFTPGSFSTITLNADGTASFMRYYRFYESGLQRSFEDSKGLLINDYQPIIEKKWMDELRKKYPVKIDEAVLKNIISN